MSLSGSPSPPGSPSPGLRPRWAPTHAQVTVLRARGLRAKAKGGGPGGPGGSSDAYAVMALGKEKFATSVAERCLGAPVWREEATFELPPPPRRGLAAAAGEPAGGVEAKQALLQLTVFHRALLGLDKFLGRAEIPLDELQRDGGRRSTRWYKLHSKPGKKEKERGEIEVDIQFMRSNMTASMFDLSMKDKSRTPFGKLKDKIKGRRGNGLPDTASAIVPSISHSPADSEEESNEKEKEKKKSRFKTLFSKPGLQKNSISQSMSVLPTLQPVTERVRLRPKDFQSQWGEEEEEDGDSTLTPGSEKPTVNRAEDNLLYPSSGKSHKRTGSADSKQIIQITSSNTKKDGHSFFGGLKSKNDSLSKSNVCINGSHIYVEQYDSKGETTSKIGTPPSPQAPQRKHLFLSQENLSLEASRESETPGRPPGPSSLDSFKAMSLPSYKLLTGGDYAESTPVVSDTPKETKENKKQENKKTGLLSLVTGKKENKIPEEVEGSVEASPKVKEVKHNEKEWARKQTNPFEVPTDGKTGPGSDKKDTPSIPVSKISLNPFHDDLVEEEKPEKSAASVKLSQTKPVKPRLGMSSEDETKATFTAPPSGSPFSSPSLYKSNNPFTSEPDPRPSVQGSGGPTGALLTSPAQRDSNQGSREQVPGCFVPDSCTFPPGRASNPFAPNCPATSVTPAPLARGPDASRHARVQPFEESQQEDGTEQGGPTPSCSERFGDQVGLTLKLQADDKVPLVSPFKGNGVNKKSVTFALDDLKEDHTQSSEDELLGTNPAGQGPQDERQDGVNPLESQRLELDLEERSASELHGEGVNSAQARVSTSEIRKTAGSLPVTGGPPVPAPRVLASLPKEACPTSTASPASSLSVPPQPAPRSALKQGRGLPATDSSGTEDALSSGTISNESSADDPPTSEKRFSVSSLAASGSSVLPSERGGGISDQLPGVTSSCDHVISPRCGTLVPGDLSGKPAAPLPAIPEVGSDDEKLSDSHQVPAKRALCEDALKSREVASKSQSSAEEADLASDIEGKMCGSGAAFGSDQSVRSRSVEGPQGSSLMIKKLEQKETERCKEPRADGCPEFSVKPVPLSPLPTSPQSSVSSFQSDALSSNRTESPKKATVEGLEDKVEVSGEKKLLRAWVSPSEIHPTQTLHSGGTNPAKLRLQPVKPMNATPNKPAAKTLGITAKILDNQNETNLKKYDPSDPAYAYAQLTHDELIQLVLKQKDAIAKRDQQVRELEDYIDNLLVRVMEETPNILRAQVHTKKKAGKM